MVCTSAVFQVCGALVSVCTCPLLLSTTITAAQSLWSGVESTMCLSGTIPVQIQGVCVCGVCVCVCVCVCVFVCVRVVWCEFVCVRVYVCVVCVCVCVYTSHCSLFMNLPISIAKVSATTSQLGFTCTRATPTSAPTASPAHSQYDDCSLKVRQPTGRHLPTLPPRLEPCEQKGEELL